MFDPLPVHPVADLFPMLAEDELQELAADIKERGLLQPIVLDTQGRVLDGRNRLAACNIAGVVPNFETYDGDDPAGFALAVNGQRREMTKRQKAVVGARMILMSNLDNKDQQIAAALGVSRSSLVEAVVVAHHADLASRVLAGTLAFSPALDEARARDAKEAAERVAKETLAEAAPDLLALVEEERMSLDDATAALEAREEKARQEAAARAREEDQRAQEELRRRRVATELLCDLVGSIAKTKGSDTADLYAPELANGGRLTARLVADARDALAHIAATLAERGAL